MTTPGKNYPALPAFLPTPDSTPETTVCRSFSIPDNDDWLGLLMGALNILSQEWAYYPWGIVSAEDTAARWNDIINQAYADSLTPGACTLVPAPFWDESSGDDAPDEAPANDQRWYGRWDGETFLETVAYTFLTGFVATLVGEQAAIKFLTIPRAFRVLIRQNPHGANLLLFLDGGLYKVINGYSPFDRVAEFLIASPGTELMLVVDSTHDPSSTPNAHGDFVVDVIRTRLSEDDVTNPNVRYSGTPPIFQTSYDDGTTWVDTPSSDVRHAAFAAFPHLTHYTGIECDTAARMTAQLKASIDLMCSVADAAQAVTGLLELILLPTGLVGALLSLFFTICDWIIDNGQATILAAFTTTVYHDIECILFCHIETDGSITQARLDGAWEQAKALHPGTVATVIDEVRFLFTDNIFTNAGVKRTETGDCSACDACGWCYHFDDAHQLGDWVAFQWNGSSGEILPSYSAPVWNNGQVVAGTPVSYIHIRWVLGSAITLTDASITEQAGSATGGGQGIYVNGDGSIFSGTQVYALGGSYTGGSISVTSIDVLIFVAGGSDPITLTSLQFSGSDTTNPFGDSNC